MWIALSVACAFGNALWTSLSKPIVQDIPPLRMLTIFRALVSLSLIVPFVLYGTFPASLWFWLVVAAIGILHSIRWLIIMQGMKSDYFSTYAMYNTAPLFVLLLAPGLLSEQFGPQVWAGVLAITAGGVVFYRTSRISIYGLVGAVLTALVNILCKVGVEEMHPAAFIFLMQASSFVAFWVAFRLVGEKSAEATGVRWSEVRRIAPLAILSAAGGVVFMYAISLDTATRVTAVVRTNLIFGFALSYGMLGEKSDWIWKAIGTMLILAGTVAVAF
ncbi:MAG: DMT family transporter [Armatimonadetes bacterium]|nr:DMT family transporter [Armatimonadota bacterium]